MEIKDLVVRNQALDPHTSFIVSAPAGSGKTYLLTRRILNLMLHVSCPSHVVAITFTKKAALEMQERLLQCLEEQQEEVAKQVMQRSIKLRWDILNHPEKLSIMTIDAYCGWLLSYSNTPFIAPVSQSPMTLYRDTIYQYYHQANWAPEQHAILAQFHGQYALLEELLSSLLATRDGFSHYLTTKDLQTLCQKGIQAIIQASTSELTTLLSPIAETLNQLLNLHEKIAIELNEPIIYNASDCLKTHYQSLANMLLTQSGGMRKSFNKRQGIYPKSRINETVAIDQKQFLESVEILRDTLPQDTIDTLDNIRLLPSEQSIEEQDFLQALTVVLTQLIQNLSDHFEQQNTSDFIDIAIKAITALQTDPTLKKFCKENIHHVLVDEFQDTSSSQFELLSALVNLWPQSSHRTVFAVGDPMQSIYRFRQADVRLFLKLQNAPVGHIQLTPIALQCNFRSSSHLIDRVNQMFEHILPPKNLPFLAAIHYSQAIPTQPTNTHDGVYVHIEENSDPVAQAIHCIQLVQSLTQDHPNDRVAILVQSRSHLKHIIPLLQQSNIVFNAIDIYPTINLSAIRDLIALLSAITDPFDHLSWYSVLRSPLCGLSLSALNKLPTGNMLYELRHFEPDETDKPYFEKFYTTLKTALITTSNPITQVWQIWHNLYADAIYPSSQQQAITTWFSEVENRYSEGLALDKVALTNHFKSAYTSQIHQHAKVTLLTSHKSKGLEYEHVIIPHTEKKKTSSSVPLFYCENTHYPIIQPTFTDNKHNTEYFKFLNKRRDKFENDRLLYVACTRAKSTLHLLGHFEDEPPKGSWLDAIWGYQALYNNLNVNRLHTEASSINQKQKSLVRCLFVKPQPIAAEIEPVNIDSQFGTAMHYYLQHLHHPNLEKKWQHYLANHYLPTILTDRVHQALGTIQTLKSSSKQFNWIMANRDWEKNELMLDHDNDSCVIDRVFLEGDTYYIIDYKFPTHPITPNVLITRYQDQLNRYINALKGILGQHITIQAGLYLPLTDQWIIHTQDSDPRA